MRLQTRCSEGCQSPAPCWTGQIQARPNQLWARCSAEDKGAVARGRSVCQGLYLQRGSLALRRLSLCRASLQQRLETAAAHRQRLHAHVHRLLRQQPHLRTMRQLSASQESVSSLVQLLVLSLAGSAFCIYQISSDLSSHWSPLRCILVSSLASKGRCSRGLRGTMCKFHAKGVIW